MEGEGYRAAGRQHADKACVVPLPPHLACNTAASAVNTANGEINTFKQRKANQRTLRSTTVKCMLKCRLRKPEVMLPLIDALVFHVTQASRAGSLAFNALLLHALTSALLPLNDFSLFNLPDWFEVDSPKWLEKLVRQCYLGPSDGEQRSFEARFEAVKNMVQINRTYPDALVGSGQSITYASQAYVVAFENHVKVHLCDRVKTFCVRVCRDLPGVWLTAFRFVLQLPVAEGEPRLNEVMPLARVAIFAQLQERWARCAGNQLLKPRIELLFFLHVHTYLRGLPQWSVAPVCGFSRKHVRIDAAIFKGYFGPRLKQAEWYPPTFCTSKLTTDEAKAELLRWFRGVDTLRSANAGWRLNGSFQTDGYSLCATFERDELRPPKRRPNVCVGGGGRRSQQRQIVGIDPGVTNVVSVAGFNGSGVPYVCSYSSKEYELESGIRSSKEQRLRWSRPVLPILDQMSDGGAGMKTINPILQLQYLSAAADGNGALWAAYGHKKVPRCNMATYVGKTRALDRFLGSIPIRRDVRLEVSYGSARFPVAMPGTLVPSPCSLAYRRVCVWADKVTLQDEFHTTKKSFFGHTVLEDVEVQTGGRRRKLRGLKRCTTQRTLRLHRRGLLPQGWREDETRPRTLLISRDGNAALNIREPLARGNRPRWLRRPT